MMYKAREKEHDTRDNQGNLKRSGDNSVYFK